MNAATRWMILSLLRPYLRNRFLDKGKWFLLSKLNPAPGIESEWERFGTRCVQTRYAFRMYVDMVYGTHRSLYFTGEYEVLESRLIARIIGPGWRFVDIGANIGFYTLLASSLCDEVISFEPNPNTREVLLQNTDLNSCANVKVFSYALSDANGSTTLYQEGRDSGGASLLHHCRQAQEFDVSTCRGDEVITSSSARNTFLKIDVEGFEYRVLSGLPRLLAEDGVVVLVEITDSWLRQAGGSADQLFDLMAEFGFRPYLLLNPGTWVQTRTALSPLKAPQDKLQYNVLFSKPQNERASRSWIDD